MSLVNDALKRAKQMQRNNPGLPPPKLPAIPLAQSQGKSAGFPLLPMFIILGIFALGGVLLALAFNRPVPVPTIAKSAPPAIPQAPATSVAPVKKIQPPPPAAVPVAPVRKVRTVAPPAPPKPTAPVDQSVDDFPPPVSPPPGRVVSALLLAPKSHVPILQGVFYRQNKPSAIISGKTVGIGSRFGDYRVLAITSNTVTLGNAVHTNVLEMPE